MESKIKLKVVKSERLSAKKHEDRYVIIDEITGMVVENAGGHGYKSEDAVDKKELMSEMLKSHGLEVEYNMNTMVRVWESMTSTF